MTTINGNDPLGFCNPRSERLEVTSTRLFTRKCIVQNLFSTISTMLYGYLFRVIRVFLLVSERERIDNFPSINDDFGDPLEVLSFGPLSDIR
jgi:hypothetical protein